MIGLLVIALVVAACGEGDTTEVTVTPGSVPAGSSAEELTEPPRTTSTDAPAATTTTATITGASNGGCADVIGVEVSGEGPYVFAVTVSSPDTGWDKYADEWRIESEAGEILGVRELTHPHVDEQPFTRSLSDVEIEPGTSVVVAARDSVEGYCGSTVSVPVGS